MHNTQIDDVAGVLKAMAHPIRLKILYLLGDEELSVCQLRASVQTTNANISQHLSILRRHGVITCRKEANFIYNRIADPRITQLIQNLQGLFCATRVNSDKTHKAE
ncbi:ArsR/SmtB family transcription factor [Desulfobulbus alkaliphilus]|uniref:ArsR/SmtB family transcription factor n=1 Tax=Desulfobulbus alkaliphilus TaxID=869814 RepID=UPI0019645DCC|nr:metalloregulator ArsR/SmtB family transcription factor [Desulfobulbus alkaliphilus]MBM9537269.1 helix-turn-helix transcriptional regulator [Desulfobulbus alkaliphilus]